MKMMHRLNEQAMNLVLASCSITDAHFNNKRMLHNTKFAICSNVKTTRKKVKISKKPSCRHHRDLAISLSQKCHCSLKSSQTPIHIRLYNVVLFTFQTLSPMPPALPIHTAFIPASAFAPKGFHLRKQVDKRPPRRRECTSVRWICLVREEQGEADLKHVESDSVDLNVNNDDDVGGDIMHIGEVTSNDNMGGIVELDMTALNTGLGEALSRSWDNLEDFQGGEAAKENNSAEDDKEKSQSNEESNDNQKQKEPSNDLRDKPELTNQEITTTQDEHHSTSQEKIVSQDVDVSNELFDLPLIDLNQRAKQESDDAIAAINDAQSGKTKTRRKKASTTKAKTKTKAKTTSNKTKKSVLDEDQPQDKEDRTLAEILHSEVWHSEPRWFFLQVKPGCEQSCAISIRNMAQSLQSLEVQDVLVPATEILRLTKGGKSVKKEERIFPGYILVLMVMNYQNYNDVRSVPNVQYFMGDPNRDKAPKEPFRPPIPVSDAEMKVVFEKIKKADSAKVEMKTRIRPGDTIEVLYGSFTGNMGLVKEVKPDSDLVVVRLLMIGREAPVELAMNQVRVLEDADKIDTGEKTKSSRRKENETKSKSSTQSFSSAEAGMASAADDLAALLGEVPSAGDGFVSAETEEEDDLNWDFFGDESEESKGVSEEPFSFLDLEEEQTDAKSGKKEDSTWDFLDEDNAVNEGKEPFSFLDVEEEQPNSDNNSDNPEEEFDFFKNVSSEL